MRHCRSSMSSRSRRNAHTCSGARAGKSRLRCPTRHIGAARHCRREGEVTVSFAIARQAAILSASNIGSPLQRCVAGDFCPVVDELEHVLPLVQRAVALVHLQAVAHAEAPLPVTSIDGSPDVSGRSGRLTFGIPASCAVFLPKSSGSTFTLYLGVAETEIGQQRSS